MIWKYCTKSLRLLVLINLLYNFSFAQDVHHPTICECALNSTKDTSLLRKCDEKFNYAKMLPSERNDLEWRIKQCKETNPCYCWHNLDADPFLEEACKKASDTSNMNDDERKSYDRSMKHCDTTLSLDLEFRDVCECVNLTEGDRDYVIQNCRERFNLTDLAPEEQQKVVDMISVCLDKGDDEDFYLEVCPCLNAKSDDTELIERCLKRYHPDSLAPVEVAILKEKAKECMANDSELDWDLICECIQQTRTGGSMSSECEDIGVLMEDLMEKMSTEEQALFFERLMECGR